MATGEPATVSGAFDPKVTGPSVGEFHPTSNPPARPPDTGRAVTVGGWASTAARKAPKEPKVAASPTWVSQTSSAPPRATRSKGCCRPWVKIAGSSYVRHSAGRHDHRAT